MLTRSPIIVVPDRGSGVTAGVPSSSSACSNSRFGFRPTPINKVEGGSSRNPSVNWFTARSACPSVVNSLCISSASDSPAFNWRISSCEPNWWYPHVMEIPGKRSKSLDMGLPTNGHFRFKKTKAICSANWRGSDSFKYTNITRRGGKDESLASIPDWSNSSRSRKLAASFNRFCFSISNFCSASCSLSISLASSLPISVARCCAPSAARPALWADPLASPACCVTSASSRSLSLRSSAFLSRSSALLPRSVTLMDTIFIPTPSSPMIPSVINKTLPTSTLNFFIDGLSRHLSTQKCDKAHASRSSRYSCRMTHNSIATPTTTKKVNAHTKCSQCAVEPSSSLLKKPAGNALGSEFLVIDELFGSC